MRRCSKLGPRWGLLGLLIAMIVGAGVFGAGPLGEPSAALAQDAAGGDAAADTTEGDDEPPTYLEWIWNALGPGYLIIFLLLSFTLVALVVMNVLTARRDNVVPVHLVEGFEEHLNEKRYQEAYDDPVTLRYLRENHLPKLEHYNLVDVEQDRGSKRYYLVGVDHTAPIPQS